MRGSLKHGTLACVADSFPPRPVRLGAWLAALVCPWFSACAEPKQNLGARNQPPLPIQRDSSGAARLTNIGSIRGFAKGRDCTFMHCLELVLRASGAKVDYDDLMGISGLAFRTQFRVDRWEVGNPDPLVGENCLDDLFQALGWRYEFRIVRRDEQVRPESLQRAVRRSIDRGCPVLAANIIPPEDWGLITGYGPDGAWVCRSYNGGAQRVDMPAKGWPTAVVFLKRLTKRPVPKSAYAASIRRAVFLFDKRRAGWYALGYRAFDDWCQSLRSARSTSYVHANFWTYIGLIDARGAAVRYLRRIAPEFGRQARYLSAAADWYDKEVRLLIGGLRHVPAQRLYRRSLPPRDMRSKQIDLLRQAQIYERQAVNELRKAI